MIYRASVVTYAYHRSYTYPWARFRRNVGDLALFIGIDQALFCAGALLAVLALVSPDRKRWIAVTALCAHLFLLFSVGGLGAQWIYRS